MNYNENIRALMNIIYFASVNILKHVLLTASSVNNFNLSHSRAVPDSRKKRLNNVSKLSNSVRHF